MRFTINLMILISAFFSLAPCYGFEPEKHEIISEKAANLMAMDPSLKLELKMDIRDIKAFVKGSEDEDDFTLERLKNWHFYNNKGKLGRYKKFGFICECSNERIFKKRLCEFNQLIKDSASSKDIFTMMGRIAHHIQDMSSPPHVVPIYHTLCDKFDSYDPSNGKEKDLSGFIADVRKNRMGPEELLESAAQNTMVAVKSNVVFGDGRTNECETWLKFWGGPDDEKYKGFGTYGDYGNSFGKTPPCPGVIGKLYDKATYDRFFNECMDRAVLDTIRLLITFGRKENPVRSSADSSSER